MSQSSIDGWRYENTLATVLQKMGLSAARRFYVRPPQEDGVWEKVNDEDACVMEKYWCQLVEARIEHLGEAAVRTLADELAKLKFDSWAKQLHKWRDGQALPLCNRRGQRCTEIDLEVYIPQQHVFMNVPLVAVKEGTESMPLEGWLAQHVGRKLLIEVSSGRIADQSEIARKRRQCTDMVAIAKHLPEHTVIILAYNGSDPLGIGTQERFAGFPGGTRCLWIKKNDVMSFETRLVTRRAQEREDQFRKQVAVHYVVIIALLFIIVMVLLGK
eukprot:2291274-Amphidinium_carterae.1